MSRVERLAENILVLSDVVPIDGRVSWLPAGATGFEPYNEYLLLSEDRALLIETGVPLHGPSLVASLQELVGSRRLAVLPTRIELDSVGNLGRILEAFPTAVVGSANPIEPTTLVHRSDWTTPCAPFTRFSVNGTLAEFGFPRLRLVDPIIRTLGTVWLWEEATEILFTADFFCSDMLASADQSVVRRSGDARIAPEGLRASILQKFDWLELASTRNLLLAWDALFAKISPAALAPVHGRIQLGRALAAQVLEDYRNAVFFPESSAPRQLAAAAEQ
jgi:flavorubredoxin